MQKKTILVTGGAGFIGSNTVSLLLDQGHIVHVIDDLSFGFTEFIDPRATFFKGSLRDAQVLDAALHGVDAVMHFAASSIIKFSLDNPLDCITNNIIAGTELLEGMRRNNVRKIIFSSSASVYGEPESIPVKEGQQKNPVQPYGASKYAFESILHAYYKSYGIESVSLRFFNVYGPHDEQQPATRAVPIWIKNILRDEPVKIYWGGNQIRDYIFVKDVAQAHIDVLSLSGCHAFNIGSGTGIVMRTLLEEIISVIGKKATIIDGGERPGDPARLVADTEAIRKAVGWRPRISLQEGLMETVAFYRNRQ